AMASVRQTSNNVANVRFWGESGHQPEPAVLSANDLKRKFASDQTALASTTGSAAMENSRKKRNDVGVTNLAVAVLGLVLHPKSQLCFCSLGDALGTQHQLAARHRGSTALAARKDLGLLDTERDLRWAFKDFNLG